MLKSAPAHNFQSVSVTGCERLGGRGVRNVRRSKARGSDQCRTRAEVVAVWRPTEDANTIEA